MQTKIIVYGSILCPHCRQLKKNFDFYNIEYEYREITSSLMYLKEFLDLRDHNVIFNKVKEEGRVGIPLLVFGDFITFDWENYLKDNGIDKIYSEDENISCSLKDGHC